MAVNSRGTRFPSESAIAAWASSQSISQLIWTMRLEQPIDLMQLCKRMLNAALCTRDVMLAGIANMLKTLKAFGHLQKCSAAYELGEQGLMGCSFLPK